MSQESPTPHGDSTSLGTEEHHSRRAEDFLPETSGFRESFSLTAPGWLISAVVNLSILLIFSAMRIELPAVAEITQLFSAPGESDTPDELESFSDPFEDVAFELNNPTSFEADDIVNDEIVFEPDDMPMMTSIEMPDLLMDNPALSQPFSVMGSIDGDLGGRQMPGAMAAKFGGSEGSEIAVKRALDWLAKHQCADGGWTFDLKSCPSCRGQCENSGTDDKARNAATGLALLPFLGAGFTQDEGEYRQVVDRGIFFLTSRMNRTQQGASFHEPDGRMYSHGICSIALCEAYAMTRDRNLAAPAQSALNFIAYAQDPSGGGWRYEPRQSGDTSVVGWQLMALKSGRMAFLDVNDNVFAGAYNFLNTVQADNGAQYGYADPAMNRKATTAIGLLSRMYLGWDHDNEALQRGVQKLSEWGPDEKDIYYDYYATQVMRHNDGDLWEAWNLTMRDYLVSDQESTGHERGSWFFDDNHGRRGGRLYCTAMSTMILEVYYRHMPIYRMDSTEEDFEFKLD
jgi:hypothetical protein